MVSIGVEQSTESIDEIAKAMIEVLTPWYEGHRKKGKVESNVMCAGLYIAEFMATAFPLTAADYAADSQVKGASGAKAKAILAEHGELRRFTREGGRTSRATIRHAEKLAEIVNTEGAAHGVQALTPPERKALAREIQAWFVARVRVDYFARKKISAEIDPAWSVRNTVESILTAGRERGGNVAGAIAQHLVGAKLAIRFPDEDINVENYTTADAQTGRAGDYQVGDTAIHVTMAPSESLFKDRCQHNIAQGFRPRVLVPSDQILRAVVHAEDAGIDRQVAIQSIEDFVGTNIEEVAGFRKENVRKELRRLLELYNARIEQAEPDLSLMIEIPENL
ncbi:DUF4928 family protein [Streptomyces sp. NPDC051907]|uniref:DUF4928 family protein n=1 Tax=Streptomyces sp. NPDC051907 TaxID=3155284 RepID=UPI0034163FD2